MDDDFPASGDFLPASTSARLKTSVFGRGGLAERANWVGQLDEAG